MRTDNFPLSVALVVAFAISSIVEAQGHPLEFRIEVTVSCDDSALRNRITSFVSRELRQLGDVVITESDPSYRIAIVAIALTRVSGTEVGYAVSVVITSPLGDLMAGMLLKETDLTSESRQAVRQWISNYESLEFHRLLVGNEGGLRTSIEQVIADFDTEDLEKTRVIWQYVGDE